MTSRQRIDSPPPLDPLQVLSSVALRVSDQIGEDYFQALTHQLANALQVDICFIGEIMEGGRTVKSISVVDHASDLANFVYDLELTPCDNVVEGSTCCYKDNVQAAFPKDAMLLDMQIEAYAGTPLVGRDGTVLGLLSVLDRKPFPDEDIVRSVIELFSERVSAELERRHYERQLLGANQALDIARRQAEKADKAKTEFLANVSHEIRTPLNGILGIADFLLKSELAEKQLGYISIIQKSGTALLAVLTDVLDISKIDAGQMEVHNAPVDLTEILSDIGAFWQPRFVETGVKLQFSTPASTTSKIHSDAGKIKRIIENLISNAWEFTDTGHVEIRLEQARIGQKIETRVVVKDSGCGIDPAVLPDLFERFTQADGSYVRQHGGTGLGLAMCRELAHLLGGDVSAESTPGVGSTFVVTLRSAAAD